MSILEIFKNQIDFNTKNNYSGEDLWFWLLEKDNTHRLTHHKNRDEKIEFEFVTNDGKYDKLPLFKTK